MSSRPSFELAAGTHLITTTSGVVTYCGLIAAAADCSVSLYDVQAAADIAVTNKIVAFKLDIDVDGIQGGSELPLLKFSRGLCAVVAGVGAVAYLGYKKG